MKVDLAVWNRGIAEVLNRFRGSGTSTAIAKVLNDEPRAVAFVSNQQQKEALLKLCVAHRIGNRHADGSQILALTQIALLVVRGEVGPILFDTTAIMELLFSNENENEIRSLRSDLVKMNDRRVTERAELDLLSKRHQKTTSELMAMEKLLQRWSDSTLYRMWAFIDSWTGISA